jgi:diguanylate cyclase (GGDEF)-like protein
MASGMIRTVSSQTLPATRSVLAIDDSKEIHELLEVRLAPEGLLLHRALDANEGLAKARELRPDLILLDLYLPGTDGFDLCRMLKEDPTTAAIPVIFLTAATDVVAKVQGFELGAVDYVQKPFVPEELRARVRAALRSKQDRDVLSARAQVDGLTGVWNRSFFDVRFEEAIAAARRYGRAVSLVMLDVDHFKQTNDSFGHPFGDQVLQAVGDLLQTTLRATDVPCRFGGEEFALILPETEEQPAMQTAERIRMRVAELRFQPKDVPVRITASFGVACSTAFGPDRLSAKAMVEAADAALYRAKHDGRNRVCVAPAPRSAE